MPLILGNDLAGTVVAVGAGVRRFKIGDEVFARPDNDRIGTFAERIAIAEADLALKPASLDMTEAAALPLVALTAWQVLVERAQVKPGDKVLIHAGSGGVGTVAIQLAKHLGATVATTAGTDNIDLVRSLGADVVIDYRNDDFAERLSGYDVVLNTLGPDVLEKSLAVLKPGGKLISISGPPDPAFARRDRRELDRASGAAPRELQDPSQGEEARRRLFLPVHARRRRAARRDREAGRRRRDPARDRPRVRASTRRPRRWSGWQSGRSRGKVVIQVADGVSPPAPDA